MVKHVLFHVQTFGNLKQIVYILLIRDHLQKIVAFCQIYSLLVNFEIMDMVFLCSKWAQILTQFIFCDPKQMVLDLIHLV